MKRLSLCRWGAPLFSAIISLVQPSLDAGGRFEPVFFTSRNSSWAGAQASNYVPGVGLVDAKTTQILSNGDLIIYGTFTESVGVGNQGVLRGVVLRASKADQSIRPVAIGGRISLNSPNIPAGAKALLIGDCFQRFFVDSDDAGNLLVRTKFSSAEVQTQCDIQNNILVRGNDHALVKIRPDGTAEVVSTIFQRELDDQNRFIADLSPWSTVALPPMLMRYSPQPFASIRMKSSLQNGSEVQYQSASSGPDQNGYSYLFKNGTAIENLPGYIILSGGNVLASANGKHLYAVSLIKHSSQTDSQAVLSLLHIQRPQLSTVRALSLPTLSALAPKFDVHLRYSRPVHSTRPDLQSYEQNHDYTASAQIGLLSPATHFFPQLTLLDDGTIVMAVENVLLEDVEGNSPWPSYWTLTKSLGKALIRLRPLDVGFQLKVIAVSGESLMGDISKFVRAIGGFQVSDNGSIGASLLLCETSSASSTPCRSAAAAMITHNSETERKVIFHPGVTSLPGLRPGELPYFANATQTGTYGAVTPAVSNLATAVICDGTRDASYREGRVCYLFKNNEIKLLLRDGQQVPWNTNRIFGGPHSLAFSVFGMAVKHNKDKIILQASSLDAPGGSAYQDHYVTVNSRGEIEDATPSRAAGDIRNIYSNGYTVTSSSALPPGMGLVQQRLIGSRVDVGPQTWFGASLMKNVNKNLDIAFMGGGQRDCQRMSNGFDSCNDWLTNMAVRLVFDDPQNETTCRADFNGDTEVGPQDLYDYLSAYYARDTRADMNQNGDISLQDLFDFLAIYRRGC